MNTTTKCALESLRLHCLDQVTWHQTQADHLTASGICSQAAASHTAEAIRWAGYLEALDDVLGILAYRFATSTSQPAATSTTPAPTLDKTSITTYCGSSTPPPRLRSPLARFLRRMIGRRS